MLLTYVIPIYNEENTLEVIIKKVLATKLPHSFTKELILVNDASKDSSLKIAQELAKEYKEIKVISNSKNLGKSQSVKKGLLASTGDYVIIQDADLEYNPDEIVPLLELALKEKKDVVYGNRFGHSNEVIYLQNYVGNRALSLFSNLFTYPRIKVMIPDMEVCYKLAKGDIFRDIAAKIVSTTNFGLEPEVTARFSKYKVNGTHLKFGVYPIHYYARSITEGKKMKAFRDGFHALREIIKFNISKD